MRAILKAADLCASEPARAARLLVRSPPTVLPRLTERGPGKGALSPLSWSASTSFASGWNPRVG